MEEYENPELTFSQGHTKITTTYRATVHESGLRAISKKIPTTSYLNKGLGEAEP